MPICAGGTTATMGESRSTGQSGPKKITLQVYSYISKKVYNFEAYIYQFSLNINATIQKELPFGRSSRIYTHGGSARGDIKIGFFELVNSHVEDSINAAYSRASDILKEMYPQYGTVGNSLAMEKAPLVRVYSPAYISNGNVTANDEGFNALPNGALGYIENMTVSFDRSSDGAFGYFVEGETYAALSPKINYSMTFVPIDDFAPGFNENGTWNGDGPNWPFGFGSGIESEVVIAPAVDFSEGNEFIGGTTPAADAIDSALAAADAARAEADALNAYNEALLDAGVIDFFLSAQPAETAIDLTQGAVQIGMGQTAVAFED